jgi:hypothetical protein
MSHTLKIKSGSVRLNNRAFVAGQEDELAKVITPEQHEYLKRRGVLSGDLSVDDDQMAAEQEAALKAEADAKAKAQMDTLLERLSDVVDSKGVQVTGSDAIVRTIIDEPEQPSTSATSDSPAPIGEQEAQRIGEQSLTAAETTQPATTEQTSATEQPAVVTETPAVANTTAQVDKAAQKKADAAKRAAAHRAKAKAEKEAAAEKAAAEQK